MGISLVMIAARLLDTMSNICRVDHNGSHPRAPGLEHVAPLRPVLDRSGIDVQKRKSDRPPGPPTAAQPDRRVRKTREALRDALLALLPEVGWDGIDVAMLCARADVGRSTFYLHYTDKTALLRGAFEDLQVHLMSSIDAATQGSRFPFLPGLLAHVHEQREVFRALLGRRSGQVVQDHFRDLLVALFSGSVRAPRKAVSADARAHMLAGGLFQLLVWWLGASRPDGPDDIEALFLGFAVQDPTS